MPTQTLQFQGINRAITDYASAGACEELINLRPTGTGLVPVRPFTTKWHSSQTDTRVFVHKAGSANNCIHIYRTPSNLVALQEIDGEWSSDVLFMIPITGMANFSLDQVHFAAAGNIVLISISDPQDGFFENRSFLWTGTEYKENTADVPDVSVSISTGTLQVKHISTSEPLIKLDGSAQIIETSLGAKVATAQRRFEDENPTLCFGPIIVAIAFKTKDSQTFWTGRWRVYNPISAISASEIQATDGKLIFFSYRSLRSDQFTAAGIPLSMSIYLPTPSQWDAEKSALASVEVYVSKPVFYFDPESNGYALEEQDYDSGSYHIAYPARTTSELQLDDQLLYLQKSIPLSALTNPSSPFTFSLQFGGSVQTVSKTLETDAGAVTRYGTLLSYNARFHYYDSYAKTFIGSGDVAISPASDAAGQLYVVVDDGGSEKTLYLGDRTNLNRGTANIVIAPSLRVRKVITWVDGYGGREYTLTPSKRYNYSIFQGGNNVTSFQAKTQEMLDAYAAGVSGSFISAEPDAINVTEQYNPFVFRVEHSYLAPGRILDIQPQMVAVRDVSYGDYPLNVFTNRGSYALLQGDGNVLYSRFRPVSNLVTTSNSIPTESGTFFLAAGGLWTIAGNNAILVSDALSRGPHKFIRTSNGYIAISLGLYDVSALQSAVPFEDFATGATLSYNRHRDELIVANKQYAYSYVLSLKYRQWFKIDACFWQDTPGADLAIRPNSLQGGLDIVDFSAEIPEQEAGSILVHMQTRPFSVAYQYIHVYRIIQMVRAKLSTADQLIVALYGSDDLQNWHLLSYADRSGDPLTPSDPTRLSQIRTPSSARSWRYYTVCVGGTTPADTDFGPILMDYKPVIRRIG